MTVKKTTLMACFDNWNSVTLVKLLSILFGQMVAIYMCVKTAKPRSQTKNIHLQRFKDITCFLIFHCLFYILLVVSKLISI